MPTCETCVFDPENWPGTCHACDEDYSEYEPENKEGEE